MRRMFERTRDRARYDEYFLLDSTRGVSKSPVSNKHLIQILHSLRVKIFIISEINRS